MGLFGVGCVVSLKIDYQSNRIGVSQKVELAFGFEEVIYNSNKGGDIDTHTHKGISAK